MRDVPSIRYIGAASWIRDADAEFERRQACLGRLLVVGADDLDHLARQHACPRHSEPGFAFALEEREDHCITFDEHFARPILRHQLVDRLVKIQAEVLAGFRPRSDSVRVSMVESRISAFTMTWWVTFSSAGFCSSGSRNS